MLPQGSLSVTVGHTPAKGKPVGIALGNEAMRNMAFGSFNFLSWQRVRLRKKYGCPGLICIKQLQISHSRNRRSSIRTANSPSKTRESIIERAASAGDILLLHLTFEFVNFLLELAIIQIISIS